MNTSDSEQFQISFEALDPGDALHWARTGQEALEGTVEDLQREGMAISGELIPSAAEPGARGFGIDDALITLGLGVAANAISEVLSRLVVAAFARMHRPRSITVQAGEEAIQFECDEASQSIRSRLTAWLARGFASRKKITLLAD